MGNNYDITVTEDTQSNLILIIWVMSLFECVVHISNYYIQITVLVVLTLEDVNAVTDEFVVCIDRKLKFSWLVSIYDEDFDKTIGIARMLTVLIEYSNDLWQFDSIYK